MSSPLVVPRRTWGGRSRTVPVLFVILALLGLVGLGPGGLGRGGLGGGGLGGGGLGWALPVEQPAFRQSVAPLVGRTSTVCPVGGSAQALQATSVTAVVSRQAPGWDGRLMVGELGLSTPAVEVTEQGRGRRLRRPEGPVVMRGEGVMATASSGAVLTRAPTGPEAGLMAAPCTAPATSHWFPGVRASAAQTSELVLTNPDDAQATVDLRYYGETGMVIVPGSPGVLVPARSSRTVALAAAVRDSGPLTVQVRATQGRVSAMARDLFGAVGQPAGADWHPSSVAPGRTVLVPATPAGEGPRQLVVVNPGSTRAEVEVSVLGLEGAFAPAGAERIDVPPETTATLDLTAGLAGQSGGVHLSSDEPVTAAVLARTGPASLRPDVAIQPALPPLVRTGVSAIAEVPSISGELVLSNGGDTDAPCSLDVLNLDGVLLRQEDILVAARSTTFRRLDTGTTSYLVLRVPDASAVSGGVVLDSPDGPTPGLATLPLASPDVASRAPRLMPDPTTGR